MPQTVFDDPDGTLAMLRDSVASLAARHPGAASLRAKRAKGADTDPVLWQAMAEAGWTGIVLSEELGGAGLGYAEQAVLSEALGRALICEPVGAGAVFASVLLNEAHPSQERSRLAEGLVSGALRVSPAWQDPMASSRAQALTVTETADGFVLEGDRHFVDAAASATDFLVAVADKAGAVLLSVPAKTSGLSVGGRMSVDGAMIGSLHFEGCRIPASALLSRAPTLDALLAAPIRAARLAVAAELAGVAGKAVEMTIAYTKDRVQFGKPIASFQAVQHRLVEMWSDAEFACASVVNAATKLGAGNGRAAQLAVLAAKARCGDAANTVTRRGMHLHGAMGFTDEHDIGLYLKRATALSATLGQPEAMRLEFVDLERAA